MSLDPLRVKEIYQEASARDDVEERRRYLHEACGDDSELRQRLEMLLQAHDESAAQPKSDRPAVDDLGTGDYLQRGTTSDNLGGAAPLPGTLFGGRYKIKEKLGQGGMGTVYLAEQIEAVQRRVALKVINDRPGNASVMARFEQERQALALLDHPNIAKVFDAGLGSVANVPSFSFPFFAMELIKGIPITNYCDEARLSSRERLELFLPVCQAVQHAHNKGIIHRDLKPSNILVGLYDGKPVPKIIDFGVAKATGPRLTEQSVYTEVGSIIGTLEYMSPEQAECTNLDIDTRTDIYSLGVILYELLTGLLPFSRKELQAAGLAEMLRVIREVEPPKPSTKLSHSGLLPSIAATHKTEPAKLTSSLRGDLDWIVMKALEKERNRRYETASSFALDVNRYLAEEPVTAGPPSAWYRWRKFIRRHRLGVAAVAAIALTLVLGIVGTSLGLYQSEQMRLLAQSESDRANDSLASAKKNAAAARQAIEEFLIQIGDDRFSSIPQFEMVRKELVDLAVKRFREFLFIQPKDEDLRYDAAGAFQRSANLYRMMNQFAPAIELYDEAVTLFRGLAHEDPRWPKYRRDLAATLVSRGDVKIRTTGPSAAAPDYREAQDLLRELLASGAKEPEVRRAFASALSNGGDALRVTNRAAEALPQLREAAATLGELADQNQAVPFPAVLAWNNVAQAAREAGQLDVVDAALTQALERGARAVRDTNGNPNARYAVAWANMELGLLRSLQAKNKEAREAYDQAVASLEQLVLEFPKVASFRRKTAEALTALGQLALAEDRLGEASADGQKAIEVLEQLDKESAGAAFFHAYLAKAYALAGKCALRLQKPDEAKRRLGQAQQRYAQALSANPDYALLRSESQEIDLVMSSIK